MEVAVAACTAWLQQPPAARPAPALVQLALRRLEELLGRYPAAPPGERAGLQACLFGLLDPPGQLRSRLTEQLLVALQTTQPPCAFLLGLLLHPALPGLDLDRLPAMARDAVIHRLAQLRGLRRLQLAPSLPLPWSQFFSPGQTSRFTASCSHLSQLCFPRWADDPWLCAVGTGCPQLERLSVPGSVAVTDRGLFGLDCKLPRLASIDVSGTSVSPASLLSFLQHRPDLTSLGDWEEVGLILGKRRPDPPTLLTMSNVPLRQTAAWLDLPPTSHLSPAPPLVRPSWPPCPPSAPPSRAACSA